MEPSELIKQVKLRPAIWSVAYSRDDKKVTTAWRQICKLAWPDFNTFSMEEKRNKCLDLQKQWKALQVSYTKDRQRQRQQSPRGRTSRGPYYDQLSFLAANTGTVDKCATPGPSNGPGPSSTNSTPSATQTQQRPSPAATPTAQERDAEEDRQFLLSLVSFMQDVPRPSKLALRTEIMQVIAKYSGQDSTMSDRMPPMSQEY